MPGLMLTLLLGIPAKGALSNAELFQRGEEAYRAGMAQRSRKDPANRGESHFRDAIQAWEELRTRSVDNALLLRNLGHAAFLAGDLPRAILFYRLGLRRDPSDLALQQGLRQARERVVFSEGSPLGRPSETVRPAWLPEISLGWLFALAVVMYSTGWACLTRAVMVRRPQLLLAGLALLGAGGVPGWWVVERQQGAAAPIVVIAQDGVMLRKGNGVHFPAWSEVPLGRGVEAEELLSRAGWYQVRLCTGEIGWVRSAEVVIGDDPGLSP